MIAIRNAFAGVLLGSGIGPRQANAIDSRESLETCNLERDKDEKLDWRKVSVADLNRCFSSFNWLDSEGLRFYLPAMMIAELSGSYGHGVGERLSSARLTERYDCFTDAQREAVNNFLNWCLTDGDYSASESKDIMEALLNGYWKEAHNVRSYHMDHPPTVEELVGCKPPVDWLDEQHVVEYFLGKTHADAVQEYREHPYLTEDFAYMAADGLRYYLPSAFDFLRDYQSEAYESDFCHGLMCALYIQAGRDKPPPTDVIDMMKEIARYCDAHRDSFGLDPEEELFDDYIKTVLSI